MMNFSYTKLTNTQMLVIVFSFAISSVCFCFSLFLILSVFLSVSFFYYSDCYARLLILLVFSYQDYTRWCTIFDWLKIFPNIIILISNSIIHVVCVCTGLDSVVLALNGVVVGTIITHANVLTKNTLFIPIKRYLSAAILAFIFLHWFDVVYGSNEGWANTVGSRESLNFS